MFDAIGSLVFDRISKLKMFRAVAILVCLSAQIAAFKINLMSAVEGVHGKTYPGFAVFEKDEQFARFVGKPCLIHNGIVFTNTNLKFILRTKICCT